MLQPPNPSSRAAQVLAAELLTALLKTVPRRLGEALALTLSEPLFTCLQSSVAAEARGIQPQLLSLTYAALTLKPSAAAADLLVQTTMLGISTPHSPDWSHWVGFAVACRTAAGAAPRPPPPSSWPSSPPSLISCSRPRHRCRPLS